MKSWIILIVLAVVITTAGTIALPLLSSDSSAVGPEFPASAQPDGPAPKLVINEDTTFNIGTMSQEQKGKHEWTFKNEGPGMLEIRGAGVSCSCTTSDLFEGPELKTGKLIKIPPGESKQVTVSWNTKKFTGNYRQYINAATNDPLMPTIDLVVQGSIKQSLVTIPPDPSISFLSVGNDEPALRRIIVYSPDHPEMKVTSIDSSNPDLLVGQARELTQDEATGYKTDKGFWIEVTLKPSSTLGEINEEMVVKFDHPLGKTLTLKVRGKVIGPIAVTPEKVELFNATSSDGGSQELTIWARGRSSVNFKVEKKPVGMEVAIEPLPGDADVKGSKYKMTVKLAPGLESGRVEGEILLKTDDPKASEIHVPVNFLIKGTR